MRNGKYFAAILLGILSLGSMQGYAECNSARSTKEDCYKTKQGDWFTRVRALYVYPDDSSGSLSSVANSGVGVNPSWTGEFDFAYMFTKNLGAELILGTCRNSLRGKKALSGTKVGTAWLLPPTLTLQWRFFPSSMVQPYVGAGVNYTLFYGEHCDIAATKLKLDHSWGPAVQMGMDIFVYKNWFVNFDVKYVWMATTAHLTGATAGTVHVHINPWLMGVGFGCKW